MMSQAFRKQHIHASASTQCRFISTMCLPRNGVFFLVVLCIALHMSRFSLKRTNYSPGVSYLKGDNASIPVSFAPLFDPARNSELMIEWRLQTEAACRNRIETMGRNNISASSREKVIVEREALSKLKFSNQVSDNLPVDGTPYQYCRNVFIDLGTNIGDSIGHFLDLALDVCSPIWMKTHNHSRMDTVFPHPHLDVTNLDIIHNAERRNPLYALLRKELNKAIPAMSPDTFCVYGMEGNPVFTDRLQRLENYVMQMQPRLIQHLHIHTESVIAAVDGPSKLFLDKLSRKQNVSNIAFFPYSSAHEVTHCSHPPESQFWGSSILDSHSDAVNSAKKLGNGQLFYADVQGIALSTLIKSTALAYKAYATAEETTKGSLIIKMDVEGAEYQVLKEAASSGVLCDYIQKGNSVIMVVEFHEKAITDQEQLQDEKSGADDAKHALVSCGVKFEDLDPTWH